MLIEARRKMGRVEGALVFAEAPSSLVPKPRAEFFGNEGLVPFIHLGESNWVSWFPKDQVATLYLFFADYFQNKRISKISILFQNNKTISKPPKNNYYSASRRRKGDRSGVSTIWRLCWGHTEVWLIRSILIIIFLLCLVHRIAFCIFSSTVSET